MSEDTVVMSFDDFQKADKPAIKHRRSYYYRVDEYTLEGEYLKTWESCSQASNVLNINKATIGKCVRGITLEISKVGRIFLKEGADINERLKAIDNFKVSPDNKASKITVKEYDLKGNLTAVYPSICFAANFNHIAYRTIHNINEGKKLHTDDGKIFLFDGNGIKERLEAIRQRDYNSNLDRSIDRYSLKGTPNGHFRNAKEVAERFHISVLSVLDCCLGVTNSCKANIFLFSGDSINKRLKLIKQEKK